jgi:hypothetical protein
MLCPLNGSAGNRGGVRERLPYSRRADIAAAAKARIAYAAGLAVDRAGNLLISDGNDRIRMITG